MCQVFLIQIYSVTVLMIAVEIFLQYHRQKQAAVGWEVDPMIWVTFTASNAMQIDSDSDFTIHFGLLGTLII